MWKSLFVAIGIFVFLLGVQCLGTQKFVLRPQSPAPAPAAAGSGTPPPPPVQKEVIPRIWAPWGLMALGIVVFGYSCTLPRRIAGK